MALGSTTVGISEAAAYIRRGLLVVYPTETFFALGCDALNEAAVQRVFAAKRRIPTHPLPVIAACAEDACGLASRVDPTSRQLMERFWPGSLTIILPAAGHVPAAVTAGTGAVAVRVTPHQSAMRLLAACGGPLVSSSANISGCPPVTSSHDLDRELAAHAAGIVTLGEAPAGGLPSTIVKVVDDGVVVRRRGPVTEEDLIRAGFSLAANDIARNP